MKRFLSVSLGILVTLCLIVGTERRAWGYVDPGSGLIALQTIASVAAAYAYMVRRRIRAWFSRKEKKSVGLPVSAKTADPTEIA
jgi:hypothetical protein